MVKRYPTDLGQGAKISPSSALLQQLLNYSKSLEVKKVKHRKVLVNLN